MENGKIIELSSCVKQTRFSPDSSHYSMVESGPVFTVSNYFCPEKKTSINTGGDISDHDFYPGFSASHPPTQCVLIASRNRPMHLFHTDSGQSVSAYTAYSLTEEIVHPVAVKFSPQCKSIIAGFAHSTVKVWDVQRPGRQTGDMIFSTRKSRGSMKGIISAVEFANEDSFFAGTYSKSIGMFDLRDKAAKCMHVGSAAEIRGGVVQLRFIPESHLLISGHRTDRSIFAFDIRSPDLPLMELPRVVKTNQRFEFDIFKNRFLVTGDHYGDLTVFDLEKDGEIVLKNNLSPTPLVSTSVDQEGNVVAGFGTRRFADIKDSGDELSCGNGPSSSSFISFHRIVF